METLDGICARHRCDCQSAPKAWFGVAAEALPALHLYYVQGREVVPLVSIGKGGKVAMWGEDSD